MTEIYKLREFYAKSLGHSKANGVTVFKPSALNGLFRRHDKYPINELKHGDKVTAFVSRVSSCCSTWMSYKNKYHGYVLVELTARFDACFGIQLEMALMDINHNWCAIGREQSSQEYNVGDSYIVGPSEPEATP